MPKQIIGTLESIFGRLALRDLGRRATVNLWPMARMVAGSRHFAVRHEEPGYGKVGQRIPQAPVRQLTLAPIDVCAGELAPLFSDQATPSLRERKSCILGLARP